MNGEQSGRPVPRDDSSEADLARLDFAFETVVELNLPLREPGPRDRMLDQIRDREE